MESCPLRGSEYRRRLKDAVCAQYGISADRIQPAKRGFYGETWKLTGSSGSYFLKCDFLPFHQVKFQKSLSVVDYLCKNGINFAGQVLRTREGRLDGRFDGAVLGLFAWIDGENVETDQTKSAEYQMLCQVYQLTRPGLDIPRAVFSDSAAADVFRQWQYLRTAPRDEADRAVLAVLEQYGDELHRCAHQLSRFAKLCRQEPGTFFMTHGDAGGNFVAGKTQNYILDWDEAMYAPVERDAWVMSCYSWARHLFEDTLAACGLPCRLHPARLAFYCYHMYFFYLSEYLSAHQLFDQSRNITDYLQNGWIGERIRFADTLA